MKIELFGHKDERYVWKYIGEAFKSEINEPTVKLGGGRIMLWGCFAASCSGTLHRLDGIMKKD